MNTKADVQKVLCAGCASELSFAVPVSHHSAWVIGALYHEWGTFADYGGTFLACPKCKQQDVDLKDLLSKKEDDDGLG